VNLQHLHQELQSISAFDFLTTADNLP